MKHGQPTTPPKGEVIEVDTLKGLPERLRLEGRFAWRVDVMPASAKFRYKVTILPLPTSARQLLDLEGRDVGHAVSNGTDPDACEPRNCSGNRITKNPFRGTY